MTTADRALRDQRMPCYALHCSFACPAKPADTVVALQEDAHATVLQLDPGGSTAMFGVFDGHGGKQVAKYTAQHLVRFETGQ